MTGRSIPNRGSEPRLPMPVGPDGGTEARRVTRMAPCTVKVPNTGRVPASSWSSPPAWGGENAARELERLIRRCPHNEAAVADPVVAASVQMDRVDTLCDAAEALMAEHDRERELKLLLDRAAQLLDEAGRGVAEAEEFLAAAMEVELEAKAAASEAERLLTAAGTDVRSPGQLLDMADETSAGVRSVLAEQAASREVRRLRARVDQARVRIRELRSRLSRR